MIKNTLKTSEFNHFETLADEWWDPDGKFKILHSLTPIRIKYIKNKLFEKKQHIKFSKKSLSNYNILDLGCGGGLVCEPLALLGANITGIDFVKQNIIAAKKHAKKSNTNVEYLHQDINNLKFKKKYDAVLILEVLEHIEDWKKIIINVKKLLKPGGKMIISTINRNFFSKLFAIFIAENILNWVPKNTHTYSKLIKPEELKPFLNKNKINVTDVTGLIFNPLSGQWMLDKNNCLINYFCTAIKFN
ncbi:uncharacterized protein METZ01_LOCUS101104 [marine metagenome]|uniref:Methyltransferase type 11 domain-containing protein n=1 Tax=marine metagenome TaxID=408172 RepID=A0A381W6S3_9ZZZZ